MISMRITDYFYNEYEKTRTEEEWDKVARKEIAMFRLYEDNYEEFEKWAEMVGIDLEAKSHYTDYLDITCWVWEFDD